MEVLGGVWRGENVIRMQNKWKFLINKKKRFRAISSSVSLLVVQDVISQLPIPDTTPLHPSIGLFLSLWNPKAKQAFSSLPALVMVV